MIRHLKREQINEQKWDETVRLSVQSLPYAYTWYLDTVAKDWQALVKGDYEIIMPLPIKKKLNIHYLYQPFICPQLGLFAEREILEDEYELFIQSIPDKILYYDYPLNTNTFTGKNESESKPNFELQFPDNEEALFAAYVYNRRREIKIADKHINEIKSICTTEKIINFYKKVKPEIFKELQQEQISQLNSILNLMDEHKMLHSFFIENEDKKTVALITLFITKQKVINFINVSTVEAKKKNLMALLIHHSIKNFINEKQVFDFEGSSLPGVAKFFKSFGAKEKIIPRLKMNKLPAPLKWIKK